MFGKGYLRTTLLAIAACGLSCAALASTYTWTGAKGDGKWSTAGNWSVDSATATALPASEDGVVLTTTESGATAIDVDVDATVASLTFKGSESFTLASSAGKTLTTSGDWNVGAETTNAALTVSLACTLGGNLYVGCDAGLPGVLYVKEGADITATKVQIGGSVYWASDRHGGVYQTGGIVTVTAVDNEAFKLAFAGGGSTGYYALTGGTLVIPAFGSVMENSTGTFLLDGGTIKASAARTNFWENYNGTRIHFYIGANGGTFDTNGYDINLNSYAIESGVSEGLDGGLTKAGVGKLTLGASWKFTGNLTVLKGTVVDATTGTVYDGAVHTVVHERHVMTIGGVERSYALYVPATVAAKPALVVSLHGAYGSIYTETNGVYKVNDRSPFRTATADEAGCIVVYPQGLKRYLLGQWITGWQSDGTNTEDVDFFKAIIEEVAAKYPIDRTRIYLCGFSNGGMMTYAATTLASDTFAAFASISGYPLNEFHLRATGARPVPFLHIHGTSDDFVRYKLWPTIRDMMVARNGCSPVPTVTVVEGRYTNSVYAAGTGGFPYVTYECLTMGHNDYTSRTVDGNSSLTMWNFFKNYSLDDACDTTLKWRENPEAEGWNAAEHGWTVSEDKRTYAYGTNKDGGSQNVYPAIPLEANNAGAFYTLGVRTTGTAGHTVSVKLEDVDDGTVLASGTCTVGEEATFTVSTATYRQCRLTLVKADAADRIVEVSLRCIEPNLEIGGDGLTLWTGEDGGEASRSDNWQKVAGDATFCLINSDNEAVLGAGKALTVDKTMCVGRGYGERSDGTWGTGADFDHASTLTVSGGVFTVNDRLWIGSSYSDYYDSTLNISGGSVLANELYMGDCASYSGKQGRPKTSFVNLTDGSLTTTGTVQIGSYSGSVSSFTQTGGQLTVGGNLIVGGGGSVTCRLSGEVTVKGTTYVGNSSGSQPAVLWMDNAAVTMDELSPAHHCDGAVCLRNSTLTVATFARDRYGSGTARFYADNATINLTTGYEYTMSSHEVIDIGAGGLILDTGANDPRIQAFTAMTGLGGITKKGSGTLKIDANTFGFAGAYKAHGKIVVKEGTLRLPANQTIYCTGTEVAKDATLNLNGSTVVVIDPTNRVPTAVWTDAAGDRDALNPLNWETTVEFFKNKALLPEATDTFGLVPTAETDVYIPAGRTVDTTGLTAKSVTTRANEGTTYLNGDRSAVLPDLLLENDAVVDFGGGDWTFDTIAGKGVLTNANITVTGALKLVLDDEGNLSAGITCDGTFTMDVPVDNKGYTKAVTGSPEAFAAVRAYLLSAKQPVTLVAASSITLPGKWKKLLVDGPDGRTFQLVKKGNALVFEIQPSFTIHVR